MRAMLLAAFCLTLTGVVFAQDAPGPVTIGGVTYDHVDPGPAFTEATRPRQDWRAPDPFEAERGAGMMAYVTSDPGDYRPDRIPKPEEHAAKLSAFLAQGQQEPLCFGVSGLADLQGLSVTVQLPGAPLTVDVRQMHFWPQRTGWGSRQWYTTPELLLPCANGKKTVPTTRGLLEERAFDLKTGETAPFWITLSAAADAKPGTYAGTVSITSAGKPALILPLQVEVLPFKLERPRDKYWLLYADTSRWNAMSDAQVLAELRDFARHGITGLVEMPLGNPDLSQLKQGKVTFDATPYKRLASLCKQAGIPGPHVCSYGGMPERVRDALGLQGDLGKGDWPQAVKDGVATVAKAAMEATKDTPERWYFYGVDEPNGDNTYAIQEYQAWHKGGAPTYATFGDPKFLEQAASYLTAPCFVTYLISAEAGARSAREGCQKTGAEFWYYGTGSYVNPYPQEGHTFQNRYGAGFLFWKSGAKASVAWTFCRMHEDVFNDFDGSRENSAEPKDQITAYPHFLKPGDWSTYQGAIPTIAWEALRIGDDDYGYLATCSSLIAKARASKSKAATDAARAAQDTLDALVDATPWNNPMMPANFETKRMQQARRAIADHIMLLQDALRGQGHAQAPAPAAKVSVVVRAVTAEDEAPVELPAVSATRTATAPVIDGVLDDACWAKCEVAGDFRAVSTGTRAGAPTEARLAYDDKALYVAFDCHEPAMDQLVAKQTGHDTPMVWVDDGIEFFLAGTDRSKYAHFIVNTNKSVYDEINQDASWNPQAEVGLRKGADRWSVEIAVPWADLKSAGISRSGVMAANFCRSRFAGAEESPHTAWSVTGGGFHVPSRFGVAQFGSAGVALERVGVPNLWGKQAVVAQLRNLTDAPVTAHAGIVGGAAQSLTIAAHGTATARVPVELTKPGSTSIAFEWWQDGRPADRLALPVTVPAPLSVASCDPFVVDGDTVTMRVTARVAADGPQTYLVLAKVRTGDSLRTLSFPAKPGRSGRSGRLQLSIANQATLLVGLADARGKWIGSPVEQRVIALR